ncbi:MAG: orotidine-5'-phosphate decarboxylase [Betaproteobacteria bacterium]|nr:orotidine-5'-phosphate decarboxylase [Betaproteobacteria bacterium]
MISGTGAGPVVVVALDFDSAAEALAFVARLPRGACRLKVGKELFVSAGPPLVESLQREGFEVFLDLKFHDIPNTVAQACAVAAKLGVWMVNVHASGGARMMEAARDAIQRARHRPLLIGVTVLTSLGADDLAQIGLAGPTPADAAVRLASLARNCGLDGVVCSAREVVLMRERLGPEFLLVTPGIRPAGSGTDDQVRVATPGSAIRDGASYLVIGRPITRAADPASALESINAEISRMRQEGPSE